MKSSIKSMKASLLIIQRKSLLDPFHILFKSGSFLPSTNCQSRLNGCNRRKEFFRQWNLQPMLVVVGWALVWARRNKSIILYLAGCSGSVTLGKSPEKYFFLERHNFIVPFTSVVNIMRIESHWDLSNSCLVSPLNYFHNLWINCIGCKPIVYPSLTFHINLFLSLQYYCGWSWMKLFITAYFLKLIRFSRDNFIQI